MCWCRDTPRRCPVVLGHSGFIQIICNSHRTVAYLHTMSIRNSSCDTNEWLIVSPKAWFSAQNAPRSVWQSASAQTRLGNLQRFPKFLGYRVGPWREGREGKGKERNGGRRRGGTPHFWKQIVATAQLHMHLLLFGSHKLNKVSHTN